MVVVDDVVYVDGVIDDVGIGTVWGFDESEVRITAYTRIASRSSAATPAVTTTVRWFSQSCQFGSSSFGTDGMLGPALQHLVGVDRQRAL